MRAAEDDKLSRLRGVREQEGRGRREEPVSPVRVGKDGWKEGSKRGEALSRPLRRQRRRGRRSRKARMRGGWWTERGEEILGKFEREAKEGIRRIRKKGGYSNRWREKGREWRGGGVSAMAARTKRGCQSIAVARV